MPEESSQGTGNEQTNNDLSSIILLLVLYFLQGVITGLFQSLQLILSNRNASYFDQGIFNLNSWPISIKLLWAPFVDAIFLKKIGRRKSWLVPVQFLMGLILKMNASYVHKVFEESNTSDDLHEG